MKQKIIYKKKFCESPVFKRKAYVGEITPFIQEEGKYEVYIKPHSDINKGFIVIIFKGKSQKPYAHYLYPDMKKAGKAIDEFVDLIKKDYLAKEEFKQGKKNRAKVLFEKIKLGDVFYTSWGYEQTNVDFFQVIEKKLNTVIIQKIIKEEVPGSQGFMSNSVRPIKNKFIGEPFLAKITPYGLKGGTIYETAWLYTSGESGVYSSWYA